MDGNLAMNSHFENMSEKDDNDMAEYYEAFDKVDGENLERLLGKLSREFRPNSICIVPEVVQDLYSIGLYSYETGMPIDSSIAPTIYDAAQLLKSKITK